MGQIIKIQTLILLLIAAVTLNVRANVQTCLTQLTDAQFIMQSKKHGLLRFENDTVAPSFNFNSDTAFQQYLAFAHQHIAIKNPRATMPCPVITDTYKLLMRQGSRPAQATINDLIAPFELRQNNNQKAVLLIHGLTDSPFTFHDLAAFYYQQGYSVRTILLPGHGTAPSALSTISAKQWQQATRYAIKQTVNDFDEVLLGGYSTGAALIIDYITSQPVSAKITAAMLFSPATEPHNKHGWLAKWIDYIPFVNWIDEDADVDFAKYESFPFGAAAAADEAMSAISIANIKQHTIPNLAIFSAFSEVDTTIDNQVTLQLLNTLHNPKKRPANKLDRLIFYGDTAAIPANFAKSYTVINPQCNNDLCSSVYDMSHIAIPNAPSNEHYGVSAHYRNCGSYLDNDELYLQCKNNSKPNMGERTADNLAQYAPLQRLTFNPYFDQLTQQMTTFINAVENNNE